MNTQATLYSVESMDYVVFSEMNLELMKAKP